MSQGYMHLTAAALDAAIRLLEEPNGAKRSDADPYKFWRHFGDEEGLREDVTRAVHLRAINEFAGLPAEAGSHVRRAKVGGEAGIRTLGRSLKPLQRFSKPPLSATQPPHRASVSIREQDSYTEVSTATR